MVAPDMGYMAKANGGTDEVNGAEIKTVVVDPDDIIEAMRRNQRDEAEQRSHVLRITGPFEGAVEATPYVDEDHAHYPADMNNKPIHLRPELFVAHEHGAGPEHQTDIPMPTRAESRRVARENHGEDVADEVVDEYHEEAMGVWEGRVRSQLKDEVRVARNPETGAESWAAVKYQTYED